MKKNFLLVDDDKERLKNMTARLQENFKNCTCTWANDVEHALKILPYLTPDTIFCYKEQDGQPVLKQKSSARAVPVLLYDDQTIPYEIFGQVFASL
jgi:DNA-binding NtrC family response regulator